MNYDKFIMQEWVSSQKHLWWFRLDAMKQAFNLKVDLHEFPILEIVRGLFIPNPQNEDLG